MEVNQIDALDDAVLAFDDHFLRNLAKLRKLNKWSRVWNRTHFDLLLRESRWQVLEVDLLVPELVQILDVPVLCRVDIEIVRLLKVTSHEVHCHRSTFQLETL